MRRSLFLIPILAATALAAPAFAQPGGGAGRGLFVSPAGEPFRRAEGGPPPLEAWFAQADADRDGALVWAEFEADFVRWFAALDADRDGEIAPAEVARYEQEILPEMQSRVGPRSGSMRMAGEGRREGVGGGGRGRGGRRGGAPGMGGMAMMSGAARFGLLPIAHPVMDADTNFNRGVSRQEFVAAAARRFAMLNTQNSGRLTLAQLAGQRRQGFDSARRDSPGLGEED